MRGTVASVVRVEGDLLVVKGVLADGSAHGFTLNTNQDSDELPHALVGRQLTDGSWIKTVKQEKPDHVQAVFGSGFHLESSDIHMSAACLRLKNEFKVDSLEARLAELEGSWFQECETCMIPEFNPEGVQETSMKPDNIQSVNKAYEYNAEEFHSYETFIFNLGGVVTKVRREGQTVKALRNGSDADLEDQIVEKINELFAQGKRVLFLSNNSNESRRSAAKQLVQMKLRLPDKDGFKCVLNSSYTCAWFLKSAGIKKPFILCSHQGILEELQEIGIHTYVATVEYKTNKAKQEYLQPATYDNVLKLVQAHPDVDAVVVGWDTQLTTLKIAVASAYLNWAKRKDGKRIPLVACSTDTGGILGTTPHNFLAKRDFALKQVNTVGNGLMATLVISTTDKRFTTDFINVGQPSHVMLEALTKPQSEDGLGVDTKTAVLIGDALDADIAMANHGGMKSLLVFSGQTHSNDMLAEDLPAQHMPTWTLPTFADS
mmetsp:Transcript_72919/g.201255  ORF Transcript_72919/g.201255 Transcript_72919/m.201255 type:complete len:488 (-) Transcript_72919:78-1541(-)